MQEGQTDNLKQEELSEEQRPYSAPISFYVDTGVTTGQMRSILNLMEGSYKEKDKIDGVLIEHDDIDGLTARVTANEKDSTSKIDTPEEPGNHQLINLSFTSPATLQEMRRLLHKIDVVSKGQSGNTHKIEVTVLKDQSTKETMARIIVNGKTQMISLKEEENQPRESTESQRMEHIKNLCHGYLGKLLDYEHLNRTHRERLDNMIERKPDPHSFVREREEKDQIKPTPRTPFEVLELLVANRDINTLAWAIVQDEPIIRELPGDEVEVGLRWVIARKLHEEQQTLEAFQNGTKVPDIVVMRRRVQKIIDEKLEFPGIGPYTEDKLDTPANRANPRYRAYFEEERFSDSWQEARKEIQDDIRAWGRYQEREAHPVRQAHEWQQANIKGLDTSMDTSVFMQRPEYYEFYLKSMEERNAINISAEIRRQESQIAKLVQLKNGLKI